MKINISATNQPADDTVGTVVLGFGLQPMDWISKAAKLCGKGAVMDPDVARMAGANLAAGEPAALAMLRARLAPGVREAMLKQYPNAPSGAAEWLACGRRGSSSEALFTRLTGIDAVRNGSREAHPLDPDDLSRCRLMLEAVPSLQAKVGEAADMSEAWARLAPYWGEICDLMDSESPDWRAGKGKSRQTYDLMHAILEGAE